MKTVGYVTMLGGDPTGHLSSGSGTRLSEDLEDINLNQEVKMDTESHEDDIFV